MILDQHLLTFTRKLFFATTKWSYDYCASTFLVPRCCCGCCCWCSGDCGCPERNLPIGVFERRENAEEVAVGAVAEMRETAEVARAAASSSLRLRSLSSRLLAAFSRFSWSL